MFKGELQCRTAAVNTLRVFNDASINAFKVGGWVRVWVGGGWLVSARLVVGQWSVGGRLVVGW